MCIYRPLLVKFSSLPHVIAAECDDVPVRCTWRMWPQVCCIYTMFPWLEFNLQFCFKSSVVVVFLLKFIYLFIVYGSYYVQTVCIICLLHDVCIALLCLLFDHIMLWLIFVEKSENHSSAHLLFFFLVEHIHSWK